MNQTLCKILAFICLWPLLVATPGFARQGSDVISIENAAQVTLVGQLGRGRVLELAWEPDDSKLLIVSTTGLWRYSVAGTLPDAPIILNSGDWQKAAISPDHNLIATGDADGTMRVWTIAGEETATFPAEDFESVNGLAFSADGQTLAALRAGLELFDMASFSPIGAWQPGDVIATRLQFSPDGSLLAWPSFNNAIYVWDIAAGVEKYHVESEDIGLPTGIAFSPDGLTLAIAGTEKITLLDSATGAIQRTLELEGPVLALYDLDFSPDGSLIAAVGTDFADMSAAAYIWDAGTGELLNELTGARGYTNLIDISFSGEWLAYYSYDGGIRLWNFIDGAEYVLANDFYGAADTLAISADGRSLAVGGYDGSLRVWPLENRPAWVNPTWLRYYVRALGFQPDGNLLGAATDSSIYLLDTTQSEGPISPDANFDTTSRIPIEVRFSVSEQKVIIIAREGIEKFWVIRADPISGGEPELRLLAGASGELATISDDLAVVATANTTEVRLWDRVLAEQTAQLNYDSEPIALAFSPNGNQLAVAYDNETIGLWQGPEWQLAGFFEGDMGYIRSLAFNPDGTILVSGSNNTTIRLWNVATQAQLAVLNGHQASVVDFVFTPDGTRLFSGSYDSTVRVWGIKR